jgi:hypothetical protein
MFINTVIKSQINLQWVNYWLFPVDYRSLIIPRFIGSLSPIYEPPRVQKMRKQPMNEGSLNQHGGFILIGTRKNQVGLYN